MPISIYNTLTRKLEEFKSIRPGEVRMYVCGVTVYDECHLGHARSAFIFDLIRNYFKYRGYEATFIKNITDVDDKIINRAREEITDKNSLLFGKGLNSAVKEIAERYTKSFYEDMGLLGIAKADKEPKATEHIKDIIKMISTLIDNGHAYVSGGDVYFDVRKFVGYGRLSNQDKDQMLAGAHHDNLEKKRDSLDFALWKSAKENEPEWDSPWSKGRPGWHIECSAMSMRYLGDNFDIHGGGRDLIFPHHENEVAQSECATGKPFANYWIHNGLLTINGEKMSKSLGNYVSIKDVLARYPSDVLKIFFLGAHYSHPIDFTWEKMEAARNAYERILILFDRINREEGPLKAITSGGDTGNKDIFNLKQRFEEAMDDNFNTPVAIGALFDLVNLGNKILEKRPQLHQFMVKYAADILTELGGVLGLSFKTASNGLSDKEIQKLVGARIEAKKSGDFKEADRIREELKQKGIILEDDKDRTHWRRKV
ncbi:MAG: cysteine--tRNA ligase [Omnitrophica WOR_2 bacterium RIFCSPHIGHO2_01_FULL_49_10]|nr:MAG: cysteine--tRNA ligase [Omnitrophica WOR_2 bacterium RIFCSPHIGHO2_01_FULL_49_10]